MNFLDPSLPDRFWSKVSPIPFPTYGTSGCWIWTGATTGKGYGSFNLGKEGGKQKTGVAHILTSLAAGKKLPSVPRGRAVWDHKCRTRACVNPDHLEPVPEPVNVARGLSPSAVHSKKTACPRGHEYDEKNTYVYRKKRYCRTCRKKST